MSTSGKKNLSEPTFKESVVEYFKGIKTEWAKITWPDKPQVIRETIMVLVVVLFFTVVITCFDQIFAFVLGLLDQTKP